MRARTHRTLALSDEGSLEERVGGATRVGARLRELQGALDVLLRGNPVAVAAMAASAPVEDVRPQTIGSRARALGEDEGLVEEHDGLGDARLVVADDADEEHDLRPVAVPESDGDGNRGGSLEDGHRLLEPTGPDERPRLAGDETECERRNAGRRRVLTRSAEREQRIVVPVRLEQELRSACVRLEALCIGPRDAVLQVLRVRLEPPGQPLEGLARRPSLASLDLADVLLREAPSGEPRLAQPRRAPQRPHALAERVHATVGWRLPVLRRHSNMVARSAARSEPQATSGL